jgi:ParB-like chromosome segregation protein Spo0J
VPNLIWADPNTCRPNSWNSNVVSPENDEKLGNSIEALGLFKPIVVRDHPHARSVDALYEILGGEHRWAQAKARGIAKIPLFNLGVIDDEQAKKISLADNARYGADDTIKLAELLEGMEDASNIHELLPFTEADLSAIFSSSTIALDDLELDEGFEDKAAAEKSEEPAPEKAPKTHVIMRFKVTIADGERITELISKVKKRQGFTAADDLTNAGDALVHQLFGAAED